MHGHVPHSIGGSLLCVLSPELSKILFGGFLEKTTGRGNLCRQQVSRISITSTSDNGWVIRVDDRAASSPLGLKGFSMDFGTAWSDGWTPYNS